MEHESFEDPHIAGVMNEHFINIKVDREERPDVDQIYMTAVQAMAAAGRLAALRVAHPDLKPFFGGTYFPPPPATGGPDSSRSGASSTDVCRKRPRRADGPGNQVVDLRCRALDGNAAAARRSVSDAAVLDAAAPDAAAPVRLRRRRFRRARRSFPRRPPGTAAADLRLPPRPRQRRREALDMVVTTLTPHGRVAASTTTSAAASPAKRRCRWSIPHFEKMLYDNALLLSLYSDALGIGPDGLFNDAVSGIAGWMLREMRHPGGAFHAALDADSEGEEGRYYLWRRDEVRRLLDEDEYLVVETLYGLDKPANFEGKWNLHRYDAWRAVVARLSLPPERADALLASARAKLLRAREQRPRPARDDKILTGWNGLAIGGLARAAVRLDRHEWLAAAQEAADFLRREAYVDGVLHATWQEGNGGGRARFPGYLDDHAYLLDGLTMLLEAEWRDDDARFARELADILLARFEDGDNGGFYFTAHDHEALIYRPKPTQDDALPPGNAVAARALSRLGHLFGESRYLTSAERTIDWARGTMEQHPAAHCALASALQARVQPAEHIVVRGPADALAPWLAAARSGYRPWRAVYGIPYPDARVLPPYLPKVTTTDNAGRVRAYRCEGFSCSPPIESLQAFEAALADGR